MSKKQTSIEWLVNVVQSCIAPNYIPQEIIEQAKAMHKEEIIEVSCAVCLHMAEDETIFPRETSERYYEITYGDPPPPKPHIPFIYR